VREGSTTKNRKEVEMAIKNGFNGLEFLYNNLSQFSPYNNNSLDDLNNNNNNTIINNEIETN